MYRNERPSVGIGSGGKKAAPTAGSTAASPVAFTTTASGTTLSTAASSSPSATYRDAEQYNSESDEDYDPALDSSAEEDDGDDIDEDIDYVDETDAELAEGGADDAGKVLDELVSMFVQNTGRAPTEAEMQEWIGAMKSLMVGGVGEADGVSSTAAGTGTGGGNDDDGDNSLVGDEKDVADAKKPAAE